MCTFFKKQAKLVINYRICSLKYGVGVRFQNLSVIKEASLQWANIIVIRIRHYYLDIYIYISHKFRKSLCKLLDIHWFCHFLAILTRQFGRSLCYCVSILKAAYLFAFASYILSMLHCLLSPLLLLKLIDFHQNQYNPAFLPFCRNSLLWFYTVRLCLILTFNKLCYSIY